MAPRRRKTPAEIRREAAAMARADYLQRLADGDPEGAGVLQDLARAIARIRLTVTR